MTTYSKTLAGAIGASLMALGFATAAQADGYSAPGVSYARPFSWTGLYVGANGGWERTDYDQQWVFALVGPPVRPGTHIHPSDDRWTFGGHAGYQLQYGNLVAGVEVAVSTPGDWTGKHPANGSAFNTQLRHEELWTLGGRLGWAAGNFLFFGTAGYAETPIKQRLTNAAGVVQPDLGTKNSHEGAYLGAGIEYGLTRHIILGVEYQHIFLGGEQHCRDARIAAGTCLGAGDDSTSRISADIDLVRARISYKFGAREEVRPLK